MSLLSLVRWLGRTNGWAEGYWRDPGLGWGLFWASLAETADSINKQNRSEAAASEPGLPVLEQHEAYLSRITGRPSPITRPSAN